MRIHFNQAITGNRYNYRSTNTSALCTTASFSNAPKTNLDLPQVNPAYFSNISFKRNIDADFLLKQTKHLRCAYSGRLLLPQNEFKEICQKLERRTNTQEVVNLLQNYEKFMHDTELAIFGKIKEAKHKNKCDLQDILKELQPEALARLKEKQISIIKSTDSIIEKLSPSVADLVRLIRDNALAKIEDNTFGRQPPLEMIKSVKAKGADYNRIMKIYQTWYKLPNSARDEDAFIVKYARKTHLEIARRLLCPSMATIEHIVPTSRKKKNSDFLGNMILVSARFNNERHSMPLDEYIMLNQDIDMRRHLQKYIDLVIREIQRSNSDFSHCGLYPERIRKAIAKETSGKINLRTDALILTNAQKKALKAPEKLADKFIVTKDS